MPAPKKPAKVIDGVHAGAAPAAPTSRPLITNRPFMAMDPMLNPTQGAGDTTEQPSSEPPKKPVAAHSVDRTAKDIMPSAELVEAAEKEDDIVEIISGVFEGKTTGTPIGLLIRNTDQKSKTMATSPPLFAQTTPIIHTP